MRGEYGAVRKGEAGGRWPNPSTVGADKFANLVDWSVSSSLELRHASMFACLDGWYHFGILFMWDR